MSDTSTPRLVTDTRTKLKNSFRDTVETLRALTMQLPQMERIRYALMLRAGSSLPQIAEMPLLRALLAEHTFRALFELAVNEPSVWAILLDSSDPTITSEDRNDLVYRRFIEMMLLRMCAMLELKVAHRLDHTARDHDLDAQLERLLSFLSLDRVERRVVVPLLNMDLSSEQLTIVGLGQLERRRHSQAESSGFEPRSEVALSFSIRTAHFMGATQYPVWDEIKKRVTLLRLAAHPLVAYNHFVVQFFEPWEEPQPDSNFSVRFWGWRSEKLKVPAITLEEKHAAEIELMYERFENSLWTKLSPWRLACDRLDDAVFKLECRSPDAILDIVIGLEAVLAEQENRQESTHKVAVRAARYLEQANEPRRNLFRLVKRVYKVRSTLAHGQPWKLDEEGMAQIEKAAKVLARTLRVMALSERSELNLTDLDLS